MFLPDYFVSFSAMADRSRFYKLRDVPDRLHIRLLAMDSLSIDRDWAFDAVHSSFWRLYFNAGGGASLTWSGQTINIEPGRLYLIPAWLWFDCASTRVIEHLYIHFDLIGLSSTLVRQWFNRPVALAADSSLSALAAKLRQMLKAQSHDEIASICSAKALVHLAMGQLISRLSDTDDAAGVRHYLAEPNPVLPALRHMEAHLHEACGNAELAERCGLSEDHFIRVFRHHVGQSPARYALERRIAMAAERLLFSDEGIDRIAADAGFANRYHFSRAFGRVIGVPPASYRRKGRV
jgi:AraC-like DNA-binding protein